MDFGEILEDVTANLNASEGLEFTSNGDGTCYVSGIGSCEDADIVIPKKSPDRDRVTSIRYEAFAYCYRLTSVVIPDSVTSIGLGAFLNCSSLTSVTFENPNGWWYAIDPDATSGRSFLSYYLSNPSVAAKYLRSTYGEYYWFRD